MKEIIIFIITAILAFALPGCQAVPIPLWVVIVAPTSAGIGGALIGFYASPEKQTVNNSTNVMIQNITNIQIQNTTVSTYQTTSSWNGNLNVNYLDGKGTIDNLTISVNSNVLTTQTRISNGQTNYISNYSVLLNGSKKRKSK